MGDGTDHTDHTLRPEVPQWSARVPHPRREVAEVPVDAWFSRIPAPRGAPGIERLPYAS